MKTQTTITKTLTNTKGDDTMINLKDIWTAYENKGIDKLFLLYDPQTETLRIGCRFGNQDIDWEEKECSLETFAKLTTGIINDPFFVTANTEKPDNIFVEFGNCR